MVTLPDLQDWHKRIEMEAKATERSLANLRAAPEHLRGGSDLSRGGPDALHGVSEALTEPPQGNGASAIVSGRPARSVRAAASPALERDGANRRARGPRKEETREELLSRLLDPTLTLEETARMLEVCPTTVRRYTNRGILPHERSQGNQRRFKLSSVLAFMESQARVAPKAGEE